MAASQGLHPDEVKRIALNLGCSPDFDNMRKVGSSKLHGGGHSSGEKTTHRGTNPRVSGKGSHAETHELIKTKQKGKESKA